MKCPVTNCQAWTFVKETRARPKDNFTYRRYECSNEHRFTTTELVTKVTENPKKRKEKEKPNE